MARTTIFREQQLTGFQFYDYLGLYVLGVHPAPFTLTEGEEYTVFWDGAEHTCTCQQIEGMGLAIGNWSGTGTEPFIIGWSETGVSFCSLDANPHTAAIYQGEAEEEEDESLIGTGAKLLVRSGTLTAIAKAIRRKTGKTDPIPLVQMPAEIAGITGGGGSSADVRYVTFMSYDGSVEYGKKAVAVGDDCADPIARGVFSTPTRESTGQYNYTFAGWSTVAGGGLDSTALKAVNEDRTVYANFAAVVRYYTITYYDADGVTVLKTESLPYDSMPDYTPQKDGFSFDGWEPALAMVTGDASYVSKWLEKITFASGTWADIIRVADAGEAERHFALGDTREFTFTDPAGNSVTTTLKIVGFKQDTLANGSGKAGITIVTTVNSFTGKYNSTQDKVTWETCSLRSDLINKVLTNFPAELQAGIKSVKKVSRIASGTSTTSTITTNDKLWVLSIRELGRSSNYGSNIYPETHDYNYTGTSASQLGFEIGTKRIGSRTSSVGSDGYANRIVRYASNGWGIDYVNFDFMFPIGFCI